MKLRNSLLICLLLIIVAVPIWASINAEEVNIIKETEKYKNIFAKEKDYEKLSEHLGAFFGYLENACNLLTRELNDTEGLLDKINKNYKFEIRQIVPLRGRDKAVDEYADFLEKNGLVIRLEFIDPYLSPDMNFFRNGFSTVLPDVILEYFSIEAMDGDEGFENDGVLVVPWDVLREKIIRYEEYYNQICKVNCPYIRDSVSENIMEYLRAYLLGTHNSSIDDFAIEDYETSYKSLIETSGIKINFPIEPIKSYELFLSRHKESRFYNILEKYYRDLKRNQFQFRYRKEKTEERYWNEKIEENLREIFNTPFILDINNEEVSILDLADKYLSEIKLKCK